MSPNTLSSLTLGCVAAVASLAPLAAQGKNSHAGGKLSCARRTAMCVGPRRVAKVAKSRGLAGESSNGANFEYLKP